MHFDFEKLDVYKATVDYIAVIDALLDDLPTGRSYLRDQLRRAGNSIAANIAEGVGEYAPAEKARFYRMARRSAVESASHLLICRRLSLLADDCVDDALALLHRIVAMLTKMAYSVAGRQPTPTPGS